MNDDLSAALEGTRVVAVAANVPGPLAAARLAALGASVVKVEPLRGDPLETAAPQWYAQLHQHIERLQLDLSADSARELLDDRLATADLLITAMRAKALERARLAWSAVHERYPRLIQIAIVGELPPHGDRAGHDLTYQARAGVLSPPVMPRTLLADVAAAERAVSGALSALHARRRDDRGRYVEVAIVDAAREFAAPLQYGLTGEDGVLGGALPTYRLYRVLDGWVALAALEPHFIERLRELLAIDSLDADAIARALAQRPAEEWERLALSRDVPLAAVASKETPGAAFNERLARKET